MRQPICFAVPIKTVNPSRGGIGMTRGAAMAEARRNRNERTAAAIRTRAAMGLPSPLWRVKLTRLSPGVLDSHDNLRSALKHVVDGIALGLGEVDDGGGLVAWEYDQRRAPEYGVEVEIQPLWEAA